MGLKIDDAHRAEFERRLLELLDEFKERGPDPDGTTLGFFTALYADRNPPSARG